MYMLPQTRQQYLCPFKDASKTCLGDPRFQGFYIQFTTLIYIRLSDRLKITLFGEA